MAKSNPRVAGSAAVLPGTVTRIVQEHAGGAGKRKNMVVPQGLLDQARAVPGVKTETEAVALGLGAAVALAAFQREMLAGFDQLITTGVLWKIRCREVAAGDTTDCLTGGHEGRPGLPTEAWPIL